MSETMGPLGRAFATYVRTRAAELDLKQSDIADRIGMPRKTFGRYWHGERPVTIDQMVSIIGALGDDPDDVLTDKLPQIIRAQK